MEESENISNKVLNNTTETLIDISSASKQTEPLERKSQIGKTAEYLKKCHAAIDTFTSEMKEDKESNKNIQIEILEEYKNIRKIQEDFVKSVKEQWALANAQREERNKILKEIAKNFNNKSLLKNNLF